MSAADFGGRTRRHPVVTLAARRSRMARAAADPGWTRGMRRRYILWVLPGLCLATSPSGRDDADRAPHRHRLLRCHTDEARHVDDVAGARRPLEDLLTLPFAQGAAHAFTRDAGHGGEVALGDAVPDQDTLRSLLFAQMARELQQGTGHAGTHALEARRRHVLVGLAQAARQAHYDIAVELGMPPQHVGEGGAADEVEFAGPERPNAGGPRHPVDHRQLADNGVLPENGENALIASGRNDVDGENAPAQPIAAVARVASLEQRLSLSQPQRSLAGQQLARHVVREPAQQMVEAKPFRHAIRRLQTLPLRRRMLEKQPPCDKPTRPFCALPHSGSQECHRLIDPDKAGRTDQRADYPLDLSTMKTVWSPISYGQ